MFKITIAVAILLTAIAQASETPQVAEAGDEEIYEPNLVAAVTVPEGWKSVTVKRSDGNYQLRIVSPDVSDGDAAAVDPPSQGVNRVVCYVQLTKTAGQAATTQEALNAQVRAKVGEEKARLADPAFPADLKSASFFETRDEGDVAMMVQVTSLPYADSDFADRTVDFAGFGLFRRPDYKAALYCNTQFNRDAGEIVNQPEYKGLVSLARSFKPR